MSDSTFATPDVTTFARLDGLGLRLTGQFLEPDRAVLACQVVAADQVCGRCGQHGVPRDTVTRRLAHEPFGWRPTVLLVTVRRYRCPGCGHMWRQDISKAAQPRARLSRDGLRWALQAMICQHLTVARVTEALGVSWNTANDAVLAEGKRLLIDDEHRLDEVLVIGVDEHAWRHTRKGDKYVTVIIDLTPIRDKAGAARLLDMVEDRSKKAFTDWLEQRDPAWRKGLQVVAIDGFTGFKTATTEQLPDAVAVMDPSTPSGSPVMRWTRAGAASNKTCTATAVAPATRCTVPGEPCTPELACSLTNRSNGSKRCSPSTSTSRSRQPGASTSTWSWPTATPTDDKGRRYHLLTSPPEPIDASQLRSTRHASGLTLETAARDLHCSMATLSHIERGYSSNRARMITYRDYLTSQQTASCAI